MLKESVVAMAFNSNVIEDVNIAILENIKENNDVQTLFSDFENYNNEKI